MDADGSIVEISGEPKPAKNAGGWLKCQHPLCTSPKDTLYRLTGAKRGNCNIFDKSIAVCNGCRKRPLEGQVAETPSPAKKLKIREDVQQTDIALWAQDTITKVFDEYKHTAEMPMKFAKERWHMLLRIAGLIDRKVVPNIYQASIVFQELKVTRPKLTTASKLWRDAPNKVDLANAVPREFQIGRFGQDGGKLSSS